MTDRTDNARAALLGTDTEEGALTLDRPASDGTAYSEGVADGYADAELIVRTTLDRLAAGRAETTTATVEDAARVLYLHDRHDITPPGFGERMWAEGHADGGVRQKYLGYAQALADAGLLATARTRPTRTAIARAICESTNPGIPAAWNAYRDQWLQDADAVLALFEGGDDQ